MRKLLLFVTVLLTAASAAAQVSYPPVPTAVVTQAQTDAAKAKTDAAAALAAAQSACQPMAVVPPTETPGGSAGSGINCRLVNAVQPRITRAVTGTTNASGVVTVSWTTPLDAVPIIVPIPVVPSSATQAPICVPMQGTVTVSGAQVKCFTTQSVTVSILGAIVAPVTTAASGLAVQVFAVPTTP